MSIPIWLQLYTFRMNTFNRRGIVGVILASVFTSVLPSSFAAITPPLRPSRIGQTIIWRNKKYTAIRSGRNLLWDKGVPFLSPSKTPQPSPSSSATQSSPEPSPIQVSKPQPVFKTVVEIFLCKSDEIKNGETKIFYPKDIAARGKGFVVTRTPKDLKIFDVVCTHSGCSVEMGKVQLTCFCHMSLFNNETGAPESGPAQLALTSYQGKEESGQVLVIDSF